MDTRKALAAAPIIITHNIDPWLKRTVLKSTPVDRGFDTEFRTIKVLAALLRTTFEMDVY